MATTMPDGQVISTWHIRKGATFKHRYTYSIRPTINDPAVPVDMTGWTARAQIREKEDSAVALLSLTTENGMIALDNAGNIDITIADDAFDATTAKKGVFDLELVNTLGEVRNFAGGPVVFYANVTRA